MTKKLSHFVVILLLGCGSGGDQNPFPQGVDLTNLYGDWNASQVECHPSDLSNSRYSKISKIEVRADHLLLTQKIYSDNICTQELGQTSEWYDTNWSLARSPSAFKAATKLTHHYTFNRSSGFTFTPPINIWALLKIENDFLYFYEDGAANEIDSEGYPLGNGTPVGVYAK